jgi:hypothetical protein
MRIALNGMLCAAGVLASVSASMAQAELTDEQRTNAYKSIVREKTPEPHRPPGFNISVGDRLPSSVLPNEFPNSVEDKAIQRYQYIAVNNQVVLIDPKTRKIVEVLRDK